MTDGTLHQSATKGVAKVVLTMRAMLIMECVHANLDTTVPSVSSTAARAVLTKSAMLLLECACHAILGNTVPTVK
jgi:hypothetical protein